MAESIIIHFAASCAQDVSQKLYRSFGENEADEWRWPADNFSVIVRPYLDYQTEYEKEEREAVEAKLSGEPQSSYDFEIRRTKSDEACDIIERFIRSELSDMNYVLDDMHNLYSREDIESVAELLNQYRYQKREQGGSGNAG